MEELDMLDRRIMYELDLNSRISASKLAKKLQKSKETINFRIKRLLKDGFLKGFYTVFNTSKLGWHYCKFYIKFKNITPEKEKEFFDYVQKQFHIAYLASVEGYFDCILLVMVKSSKGVIDFLYPLMKLYGEYIQEKEMTIFLTTHRLNQKFLYAGEERSNLSYPIEIGNYKLDKINQAILNLLSENARIPLIELASKLSLDAAAVKYRLKKLENEEIILGYVTSPNFERLGLEFVQINISLREPQAKTAIIKYFDSTNSCLFALEMIGKYDLAVEVHVKNQEERKGIIDGFRRQFVKDYTDYDVSTITREYLVVWSPFAEKLAIQILSAPPA